MNCQINYCTLAYIPKYVANIAAIEFVCEHQLQVECKQSYRVKTDPQLMKT